MPLIISPFAKHNQRLLNISNSVNLFNILKDTTTELFNDILNGSILIPDNRTQLLNNFDAESNLPPLIRNIMKRNTGSNNYTGFNFLKIFSGINDPKKLIDYIGSKQKPFLINLADIHSGLIKDLYGFRQLLRTDQLFNLEHLEESQESNSLFKYVFNIDNERSIPTNIPISTTYLIYIMFTRIYNLAFDVYVQENQATIYIDNEIEVQPFIEQFDTFMDNNNDIIAEQISLFILKNILLLVDSYSDDFFNALKIKISETLPELKTVFANTSTENISKFSASYIVKNSFKNLSRYLAKKEVNSRQNWSTGNNSSVQQQEKLIYKAIRDKVHSLYRYDIYSLEYICQQFKFNPLFFVNAHCTVYNNYCLSLLNNDFMADDEIPTNEDFITDSLSNIITDIDSLLSQLSNIDLVSLIPESKAVDHAVSLHLIDINKKFVFSTEVQEFIIDTLIYNIANVVDDYLPNSTPLLHGSVDKIKIFLQVLFNNHVVEKNLWGDIFTHFENAFFEVSPMNTGISEATLLSDINYTRADTSGTRNIFNPTLQNIYLSVVIADILSNILNSYRL